MRSPDCVRPRFLVVPAALWLLAGVSWLSGEAVSASAFPGYDYATNYISDLGVAQVGSFQGRAIDSPLHALMNATFVTQGVCFAVAGVVVAVACTGVARRAVVTVGVVAVVHGVGLALVGTFHGSQGSVDDGTIVFHVLGAAAAIIGGNVVAIVAGAGSSAVGAPRAYRLTSVALGTAGLVALVMLVVDSGSSVIDLLPDGVWERGAVYTVIAWELLSAVVVLTRLARSRRLAARRHVAGGQA